MKKNPALPLFCRIVLSAAFLSAPCAQAEQPPPMENLPVILDAAGVLPPELLSGPDFSIDKRVTNDGFFNTYSFRTSTGATPVESTALLRVRIQEQSAISDMRAMEGTELFKEGLKKSAKAPIETVKGLVTEPVETVSNVAGGIGNWFSDVTRSVVSDDPYQDNVLKTAFGYSATKRQFAYSLDIDPYTPNQQVQEELSAVAQAAFSGGIVPKVAFSAINKTPGTVLSVTSTAGSMKKMVRDKSPAELEEINTEKLATMGVPDYLIKGFLRNRHFNPYEETLLVGELEAMSNTADRKILVAEAAMADSPSVAFFLRTKAHMMALYNESIAPIVRIVQVDGRTAAAVKQDGTLVGLTPVDHIPSSTLLWNKERAISQAIDAIEGIQGKELWITGTYSEDARKGLESKGWKAVDNAWEKLRK